jgi:DNA-binding LytR/AlgR family response regulator
MAKSKILVVEDEILIADNICKTLKVLGYDTLEPAINYTEAMLTIQKEEPDFAFLDINLSGKKTGIDIAKQIRNLYNFPFVFLTANSDVATLNLAKEVLPNGYLVKPFSKEELFTSIEIALHNFSKEKAKVNEEEVVNKSMLFIKEKGGYNKIIFDDILYLKSAHVYTEIFQTNGQKLVVRASLNDLISKLNEDFVRIHRGYIINIKYLEQIKSNTAKIKNELLPIGKKYNQNLVNMIDLL